MLNTRATGIGLMMAVGLVLAGPVHSDEACMKTLADIDRATATLNDLLKLRDDIAKYHASLASGAGGVAVSATLKCDACGMMMPSAPGGAFTRAVKVGGHTYYCCPGCDMSKQVDKE